MNDFRDKSEVVDKELSEFFDCEIKEILLLLDGLAGRSDKLLCDAKKESGVQELIKKIWGLAIRPGPLTDENVEFLLKTKCQLNHLVRPASGMTIAYTYMFVEDEKILPGPFTTDPSVTRYSRIRVAKDAFPGLVTHARRFRRIKDQMSWWASVITVVAAILLSIVSYGAQVVSRFEQERAAHMESINALYSTLAKQFALNAGATMPSKLIEEHCNGNNLKNETYQVVELCDEYSYIAARYDKAIKGVSMYGDSWAFWPIRFIFEVPALEGRQEDARSIAIVVSTFSNYILPILFAVIGSFAASVRGIHEKVQDGVLAPRDRILTMVRLPLGLIAGVTVGLFFDPSTAVMHVSTSFGLSLSASAIAFAAGYGAETFFSKIDQVINHVFAFRRMERPGAAQE
ncbi:hypothetical protein [Burkholderia ubonensis]|uniref:hypothetical protein n=1 Tax=Burkholderia ubonensis TaxID=101571 RepID=UPI00075BB15E|nr:hypothetical protein [Burkholderia ubonensis]KVP42732.1 hypothetical protein WJ88_31125 [Burkholderia ubonensis]KVR30370.1 hypothetical protein WK15_06125 [Burkholderia ubonensis]KWB91690.1 hypothetical protein WL45_21305 [Burkholderia ubonensis]KWE96579.1 hypothetical protein WL81_00625 [Burkholderia ubonensis]